MNEFYRKLGTLSPERRALLEKKLAEQGLQSGVRASIQRRADDLGEVPLSFAQQRLWFMQQLEPDNTAYNMKTVLRFKGTLDRTVLDDAFQVLVARHEPLRTYFAMGGNGEPAQIIEDNAHASIDFIDLRGTQNAEATARYQIEALVGAPYDLSKPPLRAALLQLAENDHLLAFGVHHIAGDRWSMGLFVRDLSILYDTALRGQPSPLPDLPVQYADWALWQRDMLQGPRLREQLDYWTSRLGGELPILELPLDRPRGVTVSFQGGHYPLALDQQLSTRLRDLARKHHVSLFTLLLAAFKALLHLYTDSDDIIVGSEVANRDRPETQGMIGPLVNTLVLRSDLSGDPDFETLLRRVNEVARGGLAHQDVPFERVVEAVNPERRLNEMTPLFQAKFDLQHTVNTPPELGGVTVEPYPLDGHAAKYELRFNLEDRDPDIRGKIEYSGDLFDEATIALLGNRFVALLELIAADPQRRLSTLDLLSGNETDALVDAAWGPRRDYPTDLCMHELFERQAALTPDSPAVTDGKTTLTYGELAQASTAIARALASLGAGPEACVGVCMRRTPQLVAVLLGILKAGAAYVPLDPDYPAERLSFIAADARLSILLADLDELPFAADPLLQILHPGSLPATTVELPGASPDNLAYVIYTSGSTGQPKGVAIEHRSAVARLHWAQEQFTPQELSGTLASTSVCFDLSIFEIFAPLAWGGQVILVDNLLALPRLPESAGVTLINTVPSLLRELLRHQPLPASIRVVNLAGEPLPPVLLASLRGDPRGLKIYNLYGPSEDTTYSTGAALHGAGYDDGLVPIGEPLPNTKAYIVDRAGRLRPDGLAGELWLGGAGLARGYLGRPEQTGQRFVQDIFSRVEGERLYRTGDRVRRRADGRLDFLGRLDHQVKIRGFRIETGEIEHHLERHPDIAEAIVVVTGEAGSPDRHLAAYYAPRSGATIDETVLRNDLATSLPAHFVPALWCALPSLPRLPNGKVDRKALPQLTAGAARSLYVAPRNEIETRLAGIWAETLGAERIGVDDSFFEVGGHSLLAIRIVARIEEQFGVVLPLKALFQNPTVSGLALKIAEHSHGVAETVRPKPVANPAARFEPFPLTDIQHAYWLGRNRAFELGSVGSHGYREFDVDGLDIADFQLALRKLIDRHDMLRAVVDPDGRQRVLEDVPAYRIDVADLREAADAEQQILAIRARLSHQIFSADRWPLFHVEAARIDAKTTRLFVGFDVLIGDAWSFKLMARELAALLAGEELPPLELTFRDYVLAEQAYQEGPAYDHAWAYWQQRLETLPPSPELPLARSPSQIEKPHFRRRSSGLSAADWASFKARAAASGLTPTSAVMAAFSEVLGRWSRRPQFTLNLTVFSREPVHPQVGSIVGDFTASLLLGLDLSCRGSFAAGAKALQERLLEDLDHRAVSGVRVLRELTRRQNRPAAALMPVVFTSVLNQASPEGQARPLEARLVNSVSQTPQVYLDHQAAEEQGALVYNWDAIEELFPQDLLDTMFAAYDGFLQSLARDDGAWHAQPDLGGSQHFDALNQVAAIALPGHDSLLHSGFFEQAARTPERIAVVGDDLELTYGEVAARALALAATLQDAGAVANQLVAVSLEKSPAQVIACLGILAAGAAYVPIDPDLPRERRCQLIEDTQASLVICTGGEWPDDLRQIEVPAARGGTPRPVATQPTDLAYVIFTSGSTGRPKGVMIDHRGAVNTVLDINRRFAVSEDDRVFALSSLSFDLSVYDVFGPLAVGGALVIPAATETKETASWPGLMTRHKVTVWNSVPALAQLLVTELTGVAARPHLRLVMMSGDWIPVSLPDALRAQMPGVEVISLGGATEASIWSIYYPVETVSPEWASIPYGYPLANQRWYVLDDEGRLCQPWVPGRLFIGGVGVARGYWGRPVLTAERFIPDPFATREEAAAGALYLYDTGDMGRYRGDGALEFLGREDFQVKINGFRIELGEIEANLLQHPAVTEAVVSTAGSPPSLVAHIVPKLGQNAPTRFELKAGQSRHRATQSGEKHIALPDLQSHDAGWIARQSHRRFLKQPVTPEGLGALLGSLRGLSLPDAPLPKYSYPSAGSLYAVQTYVLVRDGGLAGITPGLYYYHPLRHDLVAVAGASDIAPALGSNVDLVQDSAFCLVLVARMPEVTELYGDRARDFCLLEAGYMGQVLMNSAPALRLGLCALGGLDLAALGPLLGLDADHMPIHALCGGVINPAWSESWQAATAGSSGSLTEQVRTFLGQRLPAYMVPRDVMVMDRLPLTANGKVDRQALPQPGIRHSVVVAAATAEEEQVLKLWQELLSDAQLGVEDNFFEAGGNSLTAMRLLTRLRQEFAVELTIGQLFGALTPRAQAALIGDARARPVAAPPAAIPTLQRRDETDDMHDADVEKMLAQLMAEGAS